MLITTHHQPKPSVILDLGMPPQLPLLPTLPARLLSYPSQLLRHRCITSPWHTRRLHARPPPPRPLELIPMVSQRITHHSTRMAGRSPTHTPHTHPIIRRLVIIMPLRPRDLQHPHPSRPIPCLFSLQARSTILRITSAPRIHIRLRILSP